MVNQNSDMLISYFFVKTINYKKSVTTMIYKIFFFLKKDSKPEKEQYQEEMLHVFI